MGAQDEFEKLPEWLQQLWEGAPNIARKCEAELAALRARVEQAEREREEARARVSELEAVLSKIVQESSYLDDGVNDAGDIQISRICSIAMYEDSERSTQSTTLTPRRCVTCAQEAAREMRENAENICRDWNRAPYLVGSYFGGDSIPFAMRFHLADAIAALPLPSCDGCNPLKPEATR